VVVHDVILASGDDVNPTTAARRASYFSLDALEGDPDFMTRICDCRSHQTHKKTRKKTEFEKALEKAMSKPNEENICDGAEVTLEEDGEQSGGAKNT
jgi:endoribonuclease Dicer